MIEKMSAKEKQLLRELQAKEKRARRAEADFLKEADSRREELLERWGYSDRLYTVAASGGASDDNNNVR